MYRLRNEAAPEPPSLEAVHLIDDTDEADRRLLGISLESAGYHIEIFASAESFLANVSKATSGCVILHLRTPVRDSLRLLGQLKSRNLHLPTVVAAERDDVTFAVEAMKAGAIDVVERPYTDKKMLEAVSAALAAARIDLMLASRTIEARACLSRLSQREHAVLRELVTGRRNKLVARTLNISPRTVEIHRANLMEKLGLGSLAEAVRLCVAAGLDP